MSFSHTKDVIRFTNGVGRKNWRRHTEAECSEHEQQGRAGDKEGPGGSSDPVSAAFDTFETGKDEVGTRTGHDARSSNWGK